VNRIFAKFALKMALRNMYIHRVRTILTILAITWSVATLVALKTVGVGVREKVEAEVNDFLQSDILIMEDVIVIPESVPLQIRTLPYVKDAVGTIFIPAKLGSRKTVNLVCVPADQARFFNIKLVKGRFPTHGNKEIMIDTDTARALGILSPGPKVKLTIKFGSLIFEDEYKVVGIMESRTFLSGLFGTSFALASLKPIQDLLGKERLVNYIFVKVTDRNKIDLVANTIKRLYPGANILKQTDVVNVILRIMSIVDGTLMAITLVGLLVAAVGVMNTVMMAVRERIREIGILKTIGARATHVLLIFINEVLILGLAGGVLGIAVGYFGSFILRDFVQNLGLNFEIPIHPLPDAMIGGVIIALSVAIASALYPIYRAVKVRPIEAMRFE